MNAGVGRYDIEPGEELTKPRSPRPALSTAPLARAHPRTPTEKRVPPSGRGLNRWRQISTKKEGTRPNTLPLSAVGREGNSP